MRRVVRKPLPKATIRSLGRATAILQAAHAQGRDVAISAAYKTPTIRRVLRDEMFDACCCFCDANTEVAGFGEVEHYRPKGLARFRLLAYEWSNLLWACRRCNGLKVDHWEDATPLLDPCADDPEEHLRWSDAVLVATTARGEYTLALLDLNGLRPGNLQRYEQRRDALVAVRLLWQVAAEGSLHARKARELLRDLLGPRRPYRGMLASLGMTLDAIP
jgi:uncharacterized protein (TIGR02646 family)